MYYRNLIDAILDNTAPEYTSDICIVGAGAAGITLAQSLTKKFKNVLLVESGNFEINGKTQSLYSGENLGLDYHNLSSCRLRYFGGTTNHWGGYCRYNDPIDYKKRENLGLIGWPFSYNDIEHYVQKAASILGIEYSQFEPKIKLKSLNVDPEMIIDSHNNGLSTKIFQYATNKRLGKTSLESLSSENNLRIILNLNATHIELDNNQKKIRHIVAKTISGKNIIIKSKIFILASHAIENARLLLCSNNIQSNGIGNNHDHVGRYFMEHVHLHASKFIPSNKFPMIYDREYMNNLGVNANLSFTDEQCEQLGVLQYYCRFSPVYSLGKTQESISNIKENFWKPLSTETISDISNLLNDLQSTTRLVARKITPRGFIKPAYYTLDHRIEQAPNPDSRIILSDKKDLLGSRIANLNWNLNKVDYKTFRIGQQNIISQLSSLGMGRFIIDELTNDYIDQNCKGHYHHIGTTRMANSEVDGVVDKNSKVFGIDNLYIAGSSIFPSSGYSGPTMMIIALSLRLSDHLVNNYG